jgi:hypothetical protein
MLKIIGRVLAVILLIGAALVWKEWDHIAVTASASPWEPHSGAAPAESAAARVPCAEHNPLRRAWFGDLHVHTAFSMDARSRDMLATPGDAYRYARGEEIGLGPFNDKRVGQRPVRIEQPLDFAAVTDHAEWIGEIVVCTEPGQLGYNSAACQAFRGEAAPVRSLATMIGGPSRMLNLIGFMDRQEAVCGPQNRWCRDGLKSAWVRTQEATEKYYDRSADCSFTSFHGYEYSNSLGRSKVHRNVIFRNERVPELPISSLEQGDPLGLWEQLDALCNNSAGDCEAIAIPHNSNVSNGRMFWVPWRDEPLEEQQRQAQLRARLEPVVEIMQIKGESECKSGMWNVFGEDELCDFEKLRGLGEAAPLDCRDDYGTGAIRGKGCQSRLDFARYALIEGMLEEARIGINPYRFGFAGSTDTHNASPGDVSEGDYDGCCANTDISVTERLVTKKGFAGRSPAARNPGGLMGIWAEENARDSLFDGMQRREVFATSGPRIVPRLFVGTELPETICKGGMAAAGYQHGVPMGSVITESLDSSPLFAAAVSADPNGGLLQRLQLVKVWYDAQGAFHQSVVDIAGDESNGEVDMETCAVSGVGESQFCATWRDPEFDPAQSAAWYVRALEVPSCRWSWRQCLTLPEAQRPATCADPAIPRVIQERAWSSPVWYAPSSPSLSLRK